MENFLNTVGILAVMILIIFAAYYVTRYVAVKSNRGIGSQSCLKLVDRFAISKDKMIVLISVGQSSYLIGITNQNMTVIDVIDTADLPEVKQEGKQFPSISDIRSVIKNKKISSFLNGLKNNENSSSFSDVLKEVKKTGDDDQEDNDDEG